MVRKAGNQNIINKHFFQAQFDAHEMITQRELVSQRVNVDLSERAKQFGILLDDISIVSLQTTNLFIELKVLKIFEDKNSKAYPRAIEGRKIKAVKKEAILDWY